VNAAAPVLAGRLVRLRPFSLGFSEDELLRLYAWARDAALLALSGGIRLDVPFETFRTTFIAQLHRRYDASARWFAVLVEGDGLIGRAGLYGMSEDGRSAVMGIVIGDRNYWDRGYGRDAVETIADYGFGELQLARITLQVFPENVRARKAFRAVGFVTQREALRFSLDRGTCRTLEMVLTREAWVRAGRGRSWTDRPELSASH